MSFQNKTFCFRLQFSSRTSTMNMWQLGSKAFVIFSILKVTGVTSDILLTETEEVELFEKYDEPNGRLRCLATCGDFCKKHGNDFKDSCDGHTGENYIRCNCRKTIPITKNTCSGQLAQESRSPCKKFNFVPVYKNSKCYCACKENKCNEFCDYETGLGKCIPENRQRINENPCECYCNNEECERKHSSFFKLASCDSKGKCIKKCNGTQKGLPLWCRLAKSNCYCLCEQPFCQQFCKMEGKKPYGVCKDAKNCICQDTPFSDSDCREYCKERTRSNSPIISVPSEHGRCECKYEICDESLCFENCATSDTCSLNDPSTCRDDPRVSNISAGKQTACSGNMCWSGLLEEGKPLNTSRTLVFARNKSESGNGSRLAICRSGNDGFGIAFVDKLNSGGVQCLFVFLSDNAFAIDDQFSLLLGKKYKFLKMKKGDKIPTNAFRIKEFYFGRDLKNNHIGRINKNGILTAGNILADDWERQNVIRPETFEILVCI